MPVTIHGKEYVTVAERVAAAHASGQLQAIDSVIISEDGKRYIIRAQVTLQDGRKFSGYAEESRGSRGIAGQSPLEVAETSAVGRALGFAGFGSTESIASADEVQSKVASNGGGAPTHWIEDHATQKKFWLWATNQGLSDTDVHEALSVESIKQNSGSKEEAVHAIKAYIEQQIV